MNGWSLQHTYQVWDRETEEYDDPEEVPAVRRAGRFHSAVWYLDCPPLRILGIGRQTRTAFGQSTVGEPAAELLWHPYRC
jgi:hypothetical protein